LQLVDVMEKVLQPIPAKRYFTIGEVSELCGVKPYVLRYWEQEFTQLKPMKRRGNRRYYQHHEVLLIRRIRELLYEQGFTISGARNRLVDTLRAGDADAANGTAVEEVVAAPAPVVLNADANSSGGPPTVGITGVQLEPEPLGGALSAAQMRQELISIRVLLAI
jgi:DNA-binding transcriptional MerR regulator